MKISEVFAGTAAEPTREFVELELYANGQNVFAPNSRLEFYGPSGVEIGEVPIGSLASGLHDGPFTVCATPQVRRLSIGRHSFAVRAGVDGVEDLSPAQHTWKIRRR